MKRTFATDFAFLCKPTWWNATLSPFPLVLISFGGTAFPQKYLGERRSPALLLDYTTDWSECVINDLLHCGLCAVVSETEHPSQAADFSQMQFVASQCTFDRRTFNK